MLPWLIDKKQVVINVNRNGNIDINANDWVIDVEIELDIPMD